MTRTAVRAAASLVTACAAALGSALSWSRVRYEVTVAPVIDGEPVTVSVSYHPHWLALTLLLAGLAGVLAVVGSAGLLRARRPPAARADAVSSDTRAEIP